MAFRVRAAAAADIAAMHQIRLAVRENALSDRGRIAERDYRKFVDAESAWVAEANAELIGFAVIDVGAASVWALFVDPAKEGLSVGTKLHDHMIAWAREQQLATLSLTTGPGTRAEQFYRKRGWLEAGQTASGEVRFDRAI